MKKALPRQNEVFLYERQGKVVIWDYFAEEVLEAANKGLKYEPIGTLEENLVYQNLCEWMSRYLKEGY